MLDFGGSGLAISCPPRRQWTSSRPVAAHSTWVVDVPEMGARVADGFGHDAVHQAQDATGTQQPRPPAAEFDSIPGDNCAGPGGMVVLMCRTRGKSGGSARWCVQRVGNSGDGD